MAKNRPNPDAVAAPPDKLPIDLLGAVTADRATGGASAPDPALPHGVHASHDYLPVVGPPVVTTYDADDLHRSLVSGRSLPGRRPKPDADPLLLESLALLERVLAGGLLYPSAYSVHDQMVSLVSRIREAATEQATPPAPEPTPS